MNVANAFRWQTGFYPAGSTSLFEPGRDPWALALVYWNRAANQGNVDARVKVGDYYYYGLGYENVYAPIKSQKPEAAPGQQGTLSPAEGDAVVDEAKTVEESKGSTEAALVTPPARPIWHRVLATIFGWSILGAPNFERAAMYYQTAADSEHSSLAMWNLGWMHECGVGVERDFHLAKRYYDRSLSTNPEGYLPITIALSKLRAKQIVYGLLGLESSTSGTTPKSKVTRRDDEQIVPKVDSLPAPGEAPPEREAPKSEEGEGYEWWEKQGAAVESTTENVLIAVLFGLLGLLLFVRLRHGQWRGDYQAAVAAGQVAAEAGPGLNPNGVAAFAAGANAANGLVPDRVGTPRPNQQAAGSGSELRQRRPGQADGAEAPRA